MRAAPIAACLITVLISWPAVSQPTPSSDEHSAHHPQTQVQTQMPGQVPSQGPARMPEMMGGSGQQGQSGMMAGMMGRGMMQPGTAGTMPMMAMHGTMMKIMLAIADANGDGGLSFEEVTAVHKRVFDVVDSNNDGKVTLEEINAFVQE
jgi:hypothetical protein